MNSILTGCFIVITFAGIIHFTLHVLVKLGLYDSTECFSVNIFTSGDRVRLRFKYLATFRISRGRFVVGKVELSPKDLCQYGMSND